MIETRREARPTPAAAQVLRDRILSVVEEYPDGLTTHQIASALNVTVPAVQPRVSELFAIGRLVDTKRRGRNASGKRAAIFAIAA